MQTSNLRQNPLSFGIALAAFMGSDSVKNRAPVEQVTLADMERAFGAQPTDTDEPLQGGHQVAVTDEVPQYLDDVPPEGDGVTNMTFAQFQATGRTSEDLWKDLDPGARDMYDDLGRVAGRIYGPKDGAQLVIDHCGIEHGTPPRDLWSLTIGNWSVGPTYNLEGLERQLYVFGLTEGGLVI